MKKSLFILIATIWFSSSLAIACEESNKQSFERNQQKWQTANLSSYSYIVHQQCFCPPEYRQPIRVLVQDGKVISAEFLDEENKTVSSQLINSLNTISDWFVVIENASNEHAARLEVDYDSELGYPKKIDIDMRERMVDDEQTVIISSVVKE